MEGHDQQTFQPGTDSGNAHQNSRHSQAFQTLSRDRLVRKLLSDRIWKHVVITVTLCSSPLILLIILWLRLIPDTVANWLKTGPLWALTGMELFACALLCILIATVRSASSIDFRGNYRGWKWLSGFLLACAFLLLSHSANAAAEGMALALQNFTGPLRAARPTLLIVPAAALLAHILRIVLPDMRQCRWAQALLSCSVLLAIACMLFAVRLQNSQATLIPSLALTASGFLLSALVLHTRFVIHVNPNPPLPTGVTSHGSVNASTLHQVLEQPVADFNTNAAGTEFSQARAVPSPTATEAQPHAPTEILLTTETGVASAAIHVSGDEDNEQSQDAIPVTETLPSKRTKTPGKRTRKSA
jgi:hypothetical protein